MIECLEEKRVGLRKQRYQVLVFLNVYYVPGDLLGSLYTLPMLFLFFHG